MKNKDTRTYIVSGNNKYQFSFHTRIYLLAIFRILILHIGDSKKEINTIFCVKSIRIHVLPGYDCMHYLISVYNLKKIEST